MIFVIKGLKYDTGRMEKIANVRKDYPVGGMTQRVAENLYGIKHTIYREEECELWRGKSGRWLLTHCSSGYGRGEAIEEEEARSLLLRCDYKKYEELYGDLPEA